MYLTSNANQSQLKKINIKQQDKIKELTGEELKPELAWEIIKNESKGFTIDHPKAKEADALLAELMEANGLNVTKPKVKNADRIKIRERERARTIKIMKLRLKIAA